MALSEKLGKLPIACLPIRLDPEVHRSVQVLYWKPENLVKTDSQGEPPGDPRGGGHIQCVANEARRWPWDNVTGYRR